MRERWHGHGDGDRGCRLTPIPYHLSVNKRKLLLNHQLATHEFDATFASSATYLESNVCNSQPCGGVDSSRER